DDDDDDDDEDEDIQIDVSDSRDPVAPCESFNYNVRVRNRENRSRRVDVRGFLDDKTTFLSASDGGSRDSDEVEWEDVLLRANGSKNLTVNVRVDCDAADDETLRFRARAEDEEDTELTRVEAGGSLVSSVTVSVDKQADRSEAQPGEPVFYTIIIRNTGARAVTSVKVEDTYPSLYLTISDVSDGGVNTNGVIVWTLPTLGANESRTFRYRAEVSSSAQHGQTIRNTVNAKGSGINANDAFEVRVIQELPQTGIAGFIGNITGSRSNVSATNQAHGEPNPVLPFILWTTLISVGMVGGGLMTRRFMF
ncbi:MAG TPA: hypothetical protein VI873_03050, partial [Candidatus Peribacteraceae bacterium]|nr:hypothetical protein [Candidatus Peribacteraceae bacterium]